MTQTKQAYRVIHPLDDVQEEKCDPKALGQMRLSLSVRLSLLTLRGYLILMALITVYRVVSLALGGAH
jgi:hypothetical protein